MPAMQTVYHIRDGAVPMYEIDARHAVASFPSEWASEPWPASKATEKVEPKPAEAVLIPDNWKEMKAAERIALSKKVGAKGNINAAEADAAIEAYLAAQPKPAE
ncbi:hypothetical protein [Afipia carboxidovorans]|uniref:hypothetical protein n=1 Tax=Afipia carboxidovorans TaxID=40137 RepID=UPI003088FD25|nr:hypothetical protein CRBSH125_06000 [Afipia carboxidovorans]